MGKKISYILILFVAIAFCFSSVFGVFYMRSKTIKYSLDSQVIKKLNNQFDLNEAKIQVIFEDKPSDVHGAILFKNKESEVVATSLIARDDGDINWNIYIDSNFIHRDFNNDSVSLRRKLISDFLVTEYLRINNITKTKAILENTDSILVRTE